MHLKLTFNSILMKNIKEKLEQMIDEFIKDGVVYTGHFSKEERDDLYRDFFGTDDEIRADFNIPKNVTIVTDVMTGLHSHAVGFRRDSSDIHTPPTIDTIIRKSIKHKHNINLHYILKKNKNKVDHEDVKIDSHAKFAELPKNAIINGIDVYNDPRAFIRWYRGNYYENRSDSGIKIISRSFYSSMPNIEDFTYNLRFRWGEKSLPETKGEIDPYLIEEAALIFEYFGITVKDRK